MGYVIGIDLGTSAVKALLVDRDGGVAAEASKDYPLFHEHPGWSEQNPEDWVQGTVEALRELLLVSRVAPSEVEGVSLSGQMHGLVLLDEAKRPVRRAILWNDTRTTEQCREIENALGGRLLEIARNPSLEGFTLPKILWVKRHEEELFQRADLFLMPKDYVRFRLTGMIHTDYSDAAGTLLLDVRGKEWSREILSAFDLPESLCPPLVESHAQVGTLLPDMAALTGLTTETKVFAGGADNACGAIGAGILSEGRTLSSIGTSGVILTYEADKSADYGGRVHLFNHGKENGYYSMGVTLAAGYSLSWFRKTFAAGESFDELLQGVESIRPGAGGLLFTPYLVGERTPHADANIRASFIGVDGSHTRRHFARAVMEGITFSLKESIEIFRAAGKTVDTVVSIGGGAQSPVWLQMQADIFHADVVSIRNEQGPGLGAAILAAYGSGWFGSLEETAAQFVKQGALYKPNPEAVKAYRGIFGIYRQIYPQTRGINKELAAYRY